MDVVRQVFAVTAVLALLAASLWWLRRRGLARWGRARVSRKRSLLAVERLMLGPQHSLHLVRLAGHGLLVSTSPAGCTLLERFDWASLQVPLESPEAGS